MPTLAPRALSQGGHASRAGNDDSAARIEGIREIEGQ